MRPSATLVKNFPSDMWLTPETTDLFASRSGHFEREHLEEDVPIICSSFQSHQWNASAVVAASSLRMRTMRILFLTHYYPPESGAPQNRVSALASRVKSAGH